jgi:hypothetical protein
VNHRRDIQILQARDPDVASRVGIGCKNTEVSNLSWLGWRGLSGDNGVKMLSSTRDWGSIHWSDTEPIGLKC